MAKATVYYDYDYEGNIVPIWFVLVFWRTELDWSKTLYIPINCPFETESFGNLYSKYTCSIYLDELVKNPDKLHHFGVNLSRVKERLDREGYPFQAVQCFVFQVGDIEEVLQIGDYVNTLTEKVNAQRMF
jgi:hypothetical protein